MDFQGYSQHADGLVTSYRDNVNPQVVSIYFR